MTESLAWDEVAALLARVLDEPVRGGLPLTPGWSSRTTWAAHGERTGALVVKARCGERPDEKTAWCAARLPLLAARGYPVPAIIWHGMVRDDWHVTVQNRLVEPGLVRPAQGRPDLDNPLRASRASSEDDAEPVLRPMAPEPSGGDAGAAWHFCGVGIKD